MRLVVQEMCDVANDGIGRNAVSGDELRAVEFQIGSGPRTAQDFYRKVHSSLRRARPRVTGAMNDESFSSKSVLAL